MSAFYLTFDEFRIPATNFFHYTPVGGNGNVYEERLISAVDGQPAGSVRGVTLRLPATTDWGDAHFPASADDLLEVPGSNAFMGFMPAADLSSHLVWRKALLSPQADVFVMDRKVLGVMLPKVSIQRKELGYALARKNAGNRQDLMPLRENADLFWAALMNVCDNIVKNIQDSFDHPGSQNAAFKHPEWVFFLNRALLEGFTEGHAVPQIHASGIDRNLALTSSRSYIIQEKSKERWTIALERAYEGMDIALFRAILPLPAGVRKAADAKTNNSPEQEERRVLEELAIALIEEFALKDTLFDNVDFILDQILTILTPGSSPSQIFNFWHMHYPHWDKDLFFALLQLAGWGVPVQEIEWEHITKIIFESYPSEGIGLSLWDQILRSAVNLATSVGIDIPNQFTAIVRRILTRVASQADAVAAAQAAAAAVGLAGAGDGNGH